MKTQGISLSWIVVKNIDAAIQFYTKVVGLKLREYNKEYKWAELCGEEGSALGIAQECVEQGSKAGTNAVVTVSVDDIEKAKNKFLEQGTQLVGDIVEVPGHVKMQTFLDADGNTFQLVELLH